ncbi:MAG: dihydrodipicolinate synthase family protein [Rhodospirillales bacterium]
MTDPVAAGVLAAVLTPLNADLSPDHAAWLAHCRWLLDKGCDGLAILGTTSEANSFSVDERLAMLDAIGGSGIAGARLIPGTGCCAIPDTVRLSKRAVEIGAAGVLMLPPFYYKPVSDEGLFAAYSEIIQRVGDTRLKVYLYHIPQNSGVPITFGLIERLLKAYPDTVVGIKDSAGDVTNMEAMCKSFPGFRVFTGSDAFLLRVLRAGGAGAITACNNVAPDRSAKVFAGWKGGDADALQDALNDVRLTIQAFPLVEALKELMAQATGRAGWRRLRPPLMPLSETQCRDLAAQLARTGFALKIAA